MSRPPILVVEDDTKVAGLIRLYLEHAGYAVEHVADGRAALERAAREPAPRLIVLDVMLPLIDGFEMCRRLRESSDVPVILVKG
jgi:DNA-binding response OmpR family regulator